MSLFFLCDLQLKGLNNCQNSFVCAIFAIVCCFTFIYSHLLCTFMKITCFMSPKVCFCNLDNLIIRSGHFIIGRNFWFILWSLPEISFLKFQSIVYKYINVGIKIIVRYTTNVLVYWHYMYTEWFLHLRYSRMFTLGLQ